MRNTQAWMLRQDGTAFDVNVHLYAMHDDDLSSEAEVAAFIIKTGSKDRDIAYQVLDAFMALGIENLVSYDADAAEITKCINQYLSSLPYKFAYPLTASEMIAIHESCNNYSDIDSLYDYIDALNKDQLSENIRQSINQQFCRVRFGGKYDYNAFSRSTIWFRISSVGYNWANTIYLFVADKYRSLGIDYISICRDYESDYGDDQSQPQYFYKAKDGVPYHDLPIDEYLAEEHEHSPVFSSEDIGSGVMSCIRARVANGATIHEVYSYLQANDVGFPYFALSRMLKQEISASCLADSEYFNDLHVRTRTKIAQACEEIMKEYPVITDITDVRIEQTENSRGKMVGSVLKFKLESTVNAKLNMWFDIKFNKSLGQQTAGSIVRTFKHEFNDYVNFAKL